jgi:hypothetical protein
MRFQALGCQCLRGSGCDGQELANPFGALRLAQRIVLSVDCLLIRRFI